VRRALLTALVLAVAAQLAPAAAARGGDGDVQRGRQLYGRYCSACHGPSGEGVDAWTQIGAAPLRAQVEQRAAGPSLRGVGALAADFYLRTGYMPLQRATEQPRRSRVELADQEIRDLTRYVASLAPGPAVPRPQPARGDLAEGMQLFTDRCAGCHQIVARGGYLPGAVAPPLGGATPTQIAEAVRIGPNVMPRFTHRALSDRQVDSIIAYVSWARTPDNRGGLGIGEVGPVPEGLVTWLVGIVALVGLCAVIGRRMRREG
jgi:ubiquinol-cytochrome c reductase cytochrome c subunit